MSKDQKEEFEDYVLSKKYWNTITCDVPKELLMDNILYMLRLYSRYHDEYYYKIGFTNDLKKTIKRLNFEYDSCGRIIVIMLTKVKCGKSELSFHKKYKKYSIKRVIKFKQKKEIYCISSKIYDFFKSYIRQRYYETEHYIIDDSDYETLSDGTILDQDKEEEQYWRDTISSVHT